MSEWLGLSEVSATGIYELLVIYVFRTPFNRPDVHTDAIVMLPNSSLQGLDKVFILLLK